MIVYEKNNKLNINFDNELDNPDIEIGKDEIKLGDSEITANNVLPVPEEGDTGKVPTVQEDGSYALAEASGGGGAFLVTFGTDGTTISCNKTPQEIVVAKENGQVCIAVDDSSRVYMLQKAALDGRMRLYDIEFVSMLISTNSVNFFGYEYNGTAWESNTKVVSA